MKQFLFAALAGLLLPATALRAAAQEAAGAPQDSVTIIGTAKDPAIAGVARASEAACQQRDPKKKGSRACGVFVYAFDDSRGETLSESFRGLKIEITQRALIGFAPAKDGDPAHARVALMDPFTRGTMWMPVPTLIRGWDYPYHRPGSRIEGNYHYKVIEFISPDDCKRKPALCAKYDLSHDASFDLDRFESKYKRLTNVPIQGVN